MYKQGSSRLSGNISDLCQDEVQRKKITSSHSGSQAGSSRPSTNRLQTQSFQKGSDPNTLKAGIQQTKPCSQEGPHVMERPGSKTKRSLLRQKSPTGSCIMEESKNHLTKETQTATESLYDSGKSDKELEMSQAQLEAETTRQEPFIVIPDFHIKGGLMGNSPHARYYELGHCLRANLFPGVPITMKTLVQDSYTKEVNQLSKIDMRHWHGRKIDDMGLWAEKHMEGSCIAKILQHYLDNLPKFARTWETNPDSVLKVKRPVAKMEVVKPKLPKRSNWKTEDLVQVSLSIPAAKAPSPRTDDNFWDFYNSPLPSMQ
ncbi:ciliary microtubule inner protein 4 [Microcaecilia unicolor]|uniref:Testis-expressed protein 33 n=1 Tax=Microcaecilia unicolor TaxID=1415580 RepID=A0A6P7X6X8_9AMPH|nr:testis-expressed protein 33 [Microcaecilia unicolor]